MWPLLGRNAKTPSISQDEFLDLIDKDLEVVEKSSCDSESAPSVGWIQGIWAFVQSILRYLRRIFQRFTQQVWRRIRQTYQSIDFDKIRHDLDTGRQWVQTKLYNLGVESHSFLLLQYEIWVDHSSTEWISEKTGINPETVVISLASCLFLVLTGLFYRSVRKRRMKRRQAMERTSSMSFAYGERGARDRGFSLDLSASQGSSQRTNRGFAFWNLDYFFRKRNSPTDPPPAARARARSSSNDLFGSHEMGLNVGDDLINGNHCVGAAATGARSRPTTAKILPLLQYHGPTETCLHYSTWTPPPTWTEASRSLLPTDTRIKLQREIVLELSKDHFMISVREPSSRQAPLTLAIADCSLHVKTPLIAGILQIYVKDSSKEEWMEHTFDTAKNAAQFQMDMLAIQLFGPALNRMYQALELIHQGSMACEGREYVCHHDQMSDEIAQGVGVAWDDVMRALGSNVPSLRVALERLWWHHYSMNSLRLRARKRRKQNKKGSNSNKDSNSSVGSAPGGEKEDAEEERDGADGANAGASKDDNTGPTKNQNEYIHLTADYVRKRLLLGPVDFFRLFVPALPETALPNNESTKKRMVKLLRWRKRVATSAILVQAYVKARIVANKGWVLSRPLPTHYVTRRLSFDDNIDNSQRDAASKNEYYEATVSRDVLTFVRPNDPDAFKPKKVWWEYCHPRKVRTEISKYQAFTLVGCHVFKIPQDEFFPLTPQSDPVLTFGSLRQMVESNPDLDFLVTSFFPKMSEVCHINVFVRSMPKGVDTAFDRNMSRFKHGSKEIRDQKLSMTLQLGSSETKTWTETYAITTMTYLMRSVAGDLDTSTPTSDMGPSDRMPFPMVPLARFGDTYHFGGALQDDRKLPQNYCATNVCLDSSKSHHNVLARLFMSLIERGFMSKNVYDITYVLAATKQDELPERAMASLRLARVSAKDIALPSSFVYRSKRIDHRRRSKWEAATFQSGLGNFSVGGERLRALEKYASDDDSEAQNNSLQRSTTSDSQRQRKRETAGKLLESQMTSTINTLDPIEKAVNELVEILGDVKIPVRRDQLPLYAFSAAVPLSLLEAYSATDGALRNKELMSMSLLLLITRGEIRRHYIASGCVLKKAAVRIVETAAWRGQTFPIDQRICRIELQSGQFFHQGFDVGGRPVFYFRNMGLGPWRKDHNASVAAVLHRLEGALWELSQQDDNVKCTLVVIMGKPYKEILKKRAGSENESVVAEEADEDGDFGEGSMASASFKDCNEDSPDGQRVANPRVNPDETWQIQTSKKLIRQMVTLISAHYPERLHQALVVVKPSQTISLRKLFGSSTVANLVESRVTRSKVKILNSFSELSKYVAKHELITIAGGERPINPEVFGMPD